MSKFVKQGEVEIEPADWGTIGWRCTPGGTGSTQLVVMDVSVRPGHGHDFHRHPRQEEIITVTAGEVQQWIEQECTTLRPGDSVFVRADVVHATFNDGSDPAQLVVVLSPAIDSERGYELVDVASEAPWSSLRS